MFIQIKHVQTSPLDSFEPEQDQKIRKKMSKTKKEDDK